MRLLLLALALLSIHGARAQEPASTSGGAPATGAAPSLQAAPAGETKEIPADVQLPDVPTYAGEPLIDPPSDQEGLSAWWGALGQWKIRNAAYYADGVELTDGPCTISFDRGIFVPVYNGGGAAPERVVGVAYIGDGRMRVDFPRQVDRLTFANHMAMRTGVDPATLDPIVHGGAPFETPIEQGLLLSTDPRVADLLKTLDPVGGGFRYIDTPEGVIGEYVVIDRKGKMKARVTAENMLPTRRIELIKAGMDPVAMLRMDRFLREAAGVPPDQVGLVADFKTKTRFRVASPGTVVSDQDDDRWLTCFRDGSGRFDTGGRTTVFAHGTDNTKVYHQQRFLTERFPTGHPTRGGDPSRAMDSRAAAEAGPHMEGALAEVEVRGRPTRMQKEYAVKVDSTLMLRARGGDVRYVAMRVPRDEAIKGTWKVADLSLPDRRPVAWVTLETDEELDTARLEAQQIDNRESDFDFGAEIVGETIGVKLGRRSDVLVLLPSAVPRDTEVKLHLAWEATWPYGSWARYGLDDEAYDVDTFTPLGTSTGFKQILPTLLTDPNGTRWTFTSKVAVPLLRKVGVATSGDTTREWADEASSLYWVESRGSELRRPGVAIGKWSEGEDPPSMGMPAVKVHMFSGYSQFIPDFGPEVRRILVYLDRFLPAFTGDEIEVYQAPAGFRVKKGDGHAGLVEVTTVQVTNQIGTTGETRDANQYLGQKMIARQLAWQYWGEQLPPADADQRWLSHAISDSFASFYVRGAFGPSTYFDTLDRLQKLVEDPEKMPADWPVEWHDKNHFLSLTSGGTFTRDEADLMRDYGLYVTSWMLRKHVGDQPFFRAIDHLAEDRSGRGLDTERFRRWLEWEADADFQDFFDFWIEGGFIPEITVETRAVPGEDGVTVHGCIESDVPFGRFDLPIRVVDKRVDRSVRVRAERDLEKALKSAQKSKSKKSGNKDATDAQRKLEEAAKFAASNSDRGAEGLVDVDDGIGWFEVPGRAADAEVQVDPDGLVLAYNRKVVELNPDDPPTRCELAAAARKAAIGAAEPVAE